MRALRVVALTGADGVELADLPEPAADGSILVAVRAVGIGFSTLLRAQGRYQERWEPPYTLDGEVSGVVVSAPEGSGLQPGDRVASPSGAGCAAERVALAPGTVLPLPASLSFAQGACLRNFETALFALQIRGRLRGGETLLVHGAGGGSGAAAVEVGKALGCRVIGAVSSEDKAALAKSAGADEVVRADGPWREEVLRLTEGRGVDVVFDPVGGDLMLETMRALAEGGRWIVFGFTGGIPQIPANRVLLRNIEVVGAYRTSFFRAHPDALARVDAQLMELVADGRIKPLVGTVFPLERGAEALRSIASRESVGQVILEA